MGKWYAGTSGLCFHDAADCASAARKGDDRLWPGIRVGLAGRQGGRPVCAGEGISEQPSPPVAHGAVLLSQIPCSPTLNQRWQTIVSGNPGCLLWPPERPQVCL